MPDFRHRRRVATAGALLLGLLLAPALAALEPATAASAPQPVLQPRGVWRFADDGVVFDNLPEGARLSGVTRLGPGHYRLTVLPETSPINPSPWYGFGIDTTGPRRLALEMDYAGTRHRYPPWLSSDASGTHWQAAAPSDVAVDADGNARISLDLTPGRRLVFAQPPAPLAAIDQWRDALAARTGADVQTIGHSVRGRPLQLVAFGNPDAREVVLVLGRQHPPEVTGMRALQAFVDVLAGDDADAVAFRASHRVLVVPVVNPDGVVEGHWRSNANGVDLNRDWGTFQQPETRAVAAALARQLEGRRLAFALDFHSTWHDIFYTVTEDPARQPGGVLRQWMDALETRFPGRIRERPSPATSHVFKNWVFREYAAPAVTYEVGDDTSEAQLSALAAYAAHSWMRLLDAPGVAP